MSVVEALARRGGYATRAELVADTSRGQVDAALRAAAVRISSRGRYALPSTDTHAARAHELRGLLTHESAALHHGWEVRLPPDEPHLVFARGRRLTPEQRRGIHVHRADVDPDDVSGVAVGRERTLLDCMRALPLVDALAVADSALRHGTPGSVLRRLARDARGPGARQARQVAELADGRAANPFESATRAIALDVAGLRLRPQVPIYGADFLGRPDLVDDELRIIVECDSFAWHGDRAALRADCRRYDVFVAHGWLVLRFAWEDVMFDVHWVRGILETVVAKRTDRCCGHRCAA